MKKTFITLFFMLSSITWSMSSSANPVEKITGYLYIDNGTLFTFKQTSGDYNKVEFSVSITPKYKPLSVNFNFPRYSSSAHKKEFSLSDNENKYDLAVFTTAQQTYDNIVKKYPQLRKKLFISRGNQIKHQKLKNVGIHIDEDGKANLYISDFDETIARSKPLFLIDQNVFGYPDAPNLNPPLPTDEPRGKLKTYSYYTIYDVKYKPKDKFFFATQKKMILKLNATLVRFRFLFFGDNIFLETTTKDIIQSNMSIYYKANISQIKKITHRKINKQIAILFFKAAAYCERKGKKSQQNHYTKLSLYFRDLNIHKETK